MLYQDFLKELQGNLKHEIKILKDQIASFPLLENFKYTDYCSKKVALRLYRENNPKSSFFNRVKESELRAFIYNCELNKLNDKLMSLSNKSTQITKALESFHDGRFNSSLYPNDFIIESILLYSTKEPIGSYQLMIMLISLLKVLSEKETAFLCTIERSIAENFDNEFRLRVGASIPSIFFMMSKLLKLACGNRADEYNETMESLKEGLCIGSKPQQEMEASLGNELVAINELKKYVFEGKIISPTASLDYFKKLLEEAKVCKEEQEQLISLMKIEIANSKSKQNNLLVEQSLANYEVEIFNKLKASLETLENPLLSSFLSRILDDIISICNYIVNLNIPDDLEQSYEVISIKLKQGERLVELSKNSRRANTFYYLTDSFNYPLMLRNIELIDILLYGDIFSTLKKLSNGTKGSVITSYGDYLIYAIDGRNIRLFYTEINNAIVIIEVTGDRFSYNLISNSSLLINLDYLKDNINNPQFQACQSIIEDVILQTLDLNSFGEPSADYKLKKKFETSQ